MSLDTIFVCTSNIVAHRDFLSHEKTGSPPSFTEDQSIYPVGFAASAVGGLAALRATRAIYSPHFST